MTNFSVLQREYAACVEALSEAIAQGDETAFFAAVDHIVHMREPRMLSEIRKLTGGLQKALERFSIEARLADFAAHEIPGARARLTHVISMTDAAAHRTLDLVERSGPLAERVAREAQALIEALSAEREPPAPAGSADLPHPLEAVAPVLRTVEAFLPAARRDCEQIRRNLADVLLAQGYQDLTGQVIRSVIKLVDELERTLGSLTRLSGDIVEHATLGENPDAGHGPVVPGLTRGELATAQTDVDELLSGLGM
jgi:chemotaxis protein CheZ